MTEQHDWRAQLRAPSRRLFAWAAARPTRMLMVSTESGKAQVYGWERERAQQFALPPEAKASYSWLDPAGENIYYVRDEHDSEVGELMRVRWGGGEPERVAPDLPPLYIYGLQVARDGTLYFAGAGQGCYRIYRLDRDDAQVLYEHANEAYLPFLSADETLLAFSTSEPANNRHWQATVIDAQTGRRVAQLSDGDEYAVNPAQFLMGAADVRPWSPVPDDPRLLVTSNASGDLKPSIWNVQTGERTHFAQDLAGEVRALCWSADASAAIVEQIHDGRVQLQRFDVRTGTLSALPHAAGTLNPLPMLPDGSLIYAFTNLNTALEMRELRDGRETILMAEPSAVHTQHWESVRFRSGDAEIHGFLGVPAGEPPFPAILHMHGGPTGQITDAYVPTWQHLVGEGYLFFSINFRGSTGYGRTFQEAINGHPGELELADMAAAREYLIERGLARPERIMLTGGSYGGYLTLMGLTRQPDLWRAGFALVPLCNFALMYEDANQRLKGWARMLLGGSPEERGVAHYVKHSPIAQVEKLRAPVSLIAYRSDTRTPIRQVEQFVAKLDALDAPYEVEILEGGHGTRDVQQMIHHHEQLLDFAARNLR